LVRKADSLYKAKEFRKSAETYSAAFKAFGWKGFIDDRYKAARAWTQSKIPDSAFYNLERITAKGVFKDYDRLAGDADLKLLHADKRWDALLENVKRSNDKAKSKTGSRLYQVLDSMVRVDQHWRTTMTRFENQEGDSLSRDTIYRKMFLSDSLNYSILADVFEKNGYPDADLIGEKGSHNFWLLVQRQDRHPAFQEKVLLKMKEKVDQQKVPGSDYAFLKDRVLVNAGHKQLYGTQVQLNVTRTSYEPKPVDDPVNLDERRKSMGLQPEDDFIKSMNVRYFGAPEKN